jgi:hypothetical protein
MGGGWSTPRPCGFTPGKETRYPLYRMTGGPQGRSRRVRKILTPPGFDPPRSESLYRLRNFGVYIKWADSGFSRLFEFFIIHFAVRCYCSERNPSTVLPLLTKIIRSGITFVSRNVSNFLLPLGLSLTIFGWWVSPM